MSSDQGRALKTRKLALGSKWLSGYLLLAAGSLSRSLTWLEEQNSKNTAAVVWIWCILHHLWLPGCYSSLRASSHSHINHQPDSKLRLESQTTLWKKQRASPWKTVHCCLLSSILFRDCKQEDMCFSVEQRGTVFFKCEARGWSFSGSSWPMAISRDQVENLRLMRWLMWTWKLAFRRTQQATHQIRYWKYRILILPEVFLLFCSFSHLLFCS